MKTCNYLDKHRESQIEYHGWVGEGYIIIDPATGSGAYKIAGGDDGCHLAVTDEDGNLLLLETIINSILDVYSDFKKSPFKLFSKVLGTMLIASDVVDIFEYCSGFDERLWLLFGYVQSYFFGFFAVLTASLFFGFLAGFFVAIVAAILATAVMNYLMCSSCRSLEEGCG